MPHDLEEQEQSLFGYCSVCGGLNRVWRFSEEPVVVNPRRTLVASNSVCKRCLKFLIAASEEDDEAAP